MTRAVESGGFEGLGLWFLKVVLRRVGVRKYMKKEMMGIRQKRRAAKCLGDVPSMAAPSILRGMGERNVEAKYFGKSKSILERR